MVANLNQPEEEECEKKKSVGAQLHKSPTIWSNVAQQEKAELKSNPLFLYIV